jgi:hypothetical protein
MHVTHSITLAELAAILGMVLGTAGFVIGVMNYLRDRPRVKVTLNWNMVNPQTNEKIGVLTVTNVGRRPIYIGAAALTVPKGFKHTHLVLAESIPGKKLSEGDAPAKFRVNHDGLEEYSKQWRDVRGYAEDSTGRRYVSKRLPESPVPPWVK